MNETVRGSATSQRILDAAETLFAQRGLAGASLRAITAQAGVNLAAIHYHFGSKEELIRAMYARRLEPINRRRLEMLEAAERASAPRPAPLEAVVDALAAPVLETGCGSGAGVAVLIGRVYAEPGGMAGQVLREQMGEVLSRFKRALSRALPGLPPAELAWRVHFVVGALAHTMAAGELLEFVSGGEVSGRDAEGARRRLVTFACAGLRAPWKKARRGARSLRKS